MSLRMPSLVILLLLLALPALSANIDAVTGEPIPALLGDQGEQAPAMDVQRDGPLELVTHLAEGTSKSVRALPGDVAIWQNGAYLVASDLTDPANPVELSRYLLEAQPSDIVVDGDLAYLALRKSAGLLILDYADPTAPVVVGGLPGFDLLSVAIAGDRAYCGRGSAGVLVIDISDLTAPVDITLFDTPGSANGTDIDGTILYVAQGNDGLGIYDVTDPLAPVNLASMATSGFCTYVQERDGVAYACDGSGLSLFDVSFPAAPALLASVNLGDTCYEMCFTSEPDIIAVGGLPGLALVLVASPSAPVVLNGSDVTRGYSCAQVGDVLCMASRYTGLHVLNVSLDQVSNVTNAGFAMKLQLDGDILYVADLSGGVRMYDLGDPAAPVFLGEVATDPNCQDVAAGGGMLYAVNSSNIGTGLTLTDVSDPANPQPMSVFDTTNGTMGVGVQGDICTLANGFGGLRVVDVSDPLAPALLGDLFFGAMAFDAQPVGDVAYVASFGGGMLAIDMTNPAAMTILDQEMWGYLNNVHIAAGYAWVADGQHGLRVVDIADPTDLVSLSTTGVGGQVRDVVRAPMGSDYVYAANDFYGLHVLDVSDPTAPVLLDSYPSADRGMGVDAAEELVVLAAGETGIYVFRNPAVVALEDDEPVVDLPTPALSLTAAPNPFNPRLAISYSLERGGMVRLDVFDARGRLVRTLVDANAAAGAGSVIWQGDDASGRAVASGVYQLRLTTETRVLGRSVTLVR